MPDPAAPVMDDSEPRTAGVGRHALAGATATKLAYSASASSLHSSTSSPRSTSSKKRKRRKKKSSDVSDFVPMGANFSKSSELLRSPTSNLADKANPSVPASNPVPDTNVQPSAMVSSSPNLGQNRLAKGFRSSQASAPTPVVNKSRTLSISSHDTSGGGSKDDAIEISSDEEMEDSEGGMIVNVHDNVPALTTGSVSEDEGLVTTSDDDVLQIHEDLTRATEVGDSASAKSSDLRLLDLSPDDLEEQIKYGFYHLDRTQVDLNRLVTCLSCMQLGHLASQCVKAICMHCEEHSHPGSLCPHNSRCRKCRERGHSSQDCVADLKVTTVPCDVCGRLSHVEQDCPDRHFPQPKLQAPVKLWISCCICASKSHLVGDCPDTPVNACTARWSLKSLDSNQITNMSLESGTRQLEKDAETRGMRPAGMQIRGRASLHRADTSKATTVSDDETDFLQPARGRNDQPPKPQVRLGNYEPRRPSPPRGMTTDRYDRFDAPSYDYRSQNRGHGDWYGTDSFGRRRSRSPVQDSYRPGSRRSPSPRRFDGYPQSDRGYRAAVPPSDYWRPQNGLPPRPSGSNSLGTPTTPAPSRAVQLPTRKGSNPSLPLKSTFKPVTKPVTADQPSRKNQHTQNGAKENKKKGGRMGQADNDDANHDPNDGNDFSVLGALTAGDLKVSSGHEKRRFKGQKPLFISEVADNSLPSVKTLFDAQTGQISKVQGDQCNDIASKGFKLLNKPAEANIKSPNHQAPGQNHAGVKPESQRAVAKLTHRYFLRSKQAGVLVDNNPTSQAVGSRSTTMEDATLRRAAAGVGQPKGVLGPALPALDRSVLKPTTENAYSKKKLKPELSAWLELENRLRQAQGKGPISIQRADTDGALGCYIHSYLVDDATGAYQAISPDQYGDMRKLDDLLKVHGHTGSPQNRRLTELEAYMQSMRGQALPQSPPATFLAAIQKAMRKAATEQRQVVVSNLPLDVSAVDIGRFFGVLQVETIAIAYDSITDLPTGFANVDFNTTKDAQAALECFSETSLRGKMITLELKAVETDENHEQLVESHPHDYQATTHKGNIYDKITAGVARAWSPGSGMQASNTGSSSTTTWSASPADDHDMADGTDVEDARERAKTGQGNILLHLQKLEAYLKMANQERAKFGLPAM